MERLHGRQRGECWRVEEGLLGKVPSEQKPKRSERMSPRTPGWGGPGRDPEVEAPCCAAPAFSTLRNYWIINVYWLSH